MDFLYLYLDGDSIGDRLELLLIDNQVEEASAFSLAIAEAIASVCREAALVSGVKILFSGGDDVLLYVPRFSCTPKFYEGLRIVFARRSGCTLSGGLGDSTKAALASLRRAKLTGKDKVVDGSLT